MSSWVFQQWDPKGTTRGHNFGVKEPIQAKIWVQSWKLPVPVLGQPKRLCPLQDPYTHGRSQCQEHLPMNQQHLLWRDALAPHQPWDMDTGEGDMGSQPTCRVRPRPQAMLSPNLDDPKPWCLQTLVSPNLAAPRHNVPKSPCP